MENIPPPLPVIFLEKYIERWRVIPPNIIIAPKEDSAGFDRLVMQPRFTTFSLFGESLGWNFFAIKTVVPPEEMNDDAANLYRSLKMCECRLKWRGFIRREPHFEPFEGLKNLIKTGMIGKGLKPNPELASHLASNTFLKGLLRDSNPSDLVVMLFSGLKKTDDDDVLVSDMKVYLRNAVEFYHRPLEVTYVILAVKSFLTSIERLDPLKVKPAFVRTFNLLSEVAKILENFTLYKIKQMKGLV